MATSATRAILIFVFNVPRLSNALVLRFSRPGLIHPGGTPPPWRVADQSAGAFFDTRDRREDYQECHQD